ncbi:MAG: hypothetical protein NVSMB14_02890 [Isosphaeraceae bacterium]
MAALVSEFMETVVPSDAEVRSAIKLAAHLSALLDSKSGDFALIDTEGAIEPIALPRFGLRLLAEMMVETSKGNRCRIVPVQSELTTQEAADLLNVSRPYLVGLLDAGKIPHRLVGRHRRIRLDDLMAYQRRDDDARLKVLEELTAQAQELNLGYES